MNNRKNTSPKDPNSDYDYFLKILGEYIKSERIKAGFQNANVFANLIDIAESQFREYERGETDLQLSTFIKIFKGLNKRIEDIFNLNLPGLKISVVDALTSSPSLVETQLRNQVDLVNGENFQSSLSSEDIRRILLILLFCFIPRKKREILTHLKLSSKTANFTKVWKQLIANNWITMQHANSPNIPNQKYYTTNEGKYVIQLR